MSKVKVHIIHTLVL